MAPTCVVLSEAPSCFDSMGAIWRQKPSGSIVRPKRGNLVSDPRGCKDIAPRQPALDLEAGIQGLWLNADMNDAQVTKSDLKRYSVTLPSQVAMNNNWLDKSDPCMDVFSQVFGDQLVDETNPVAPFFTISGKGLAGLQSATAELHSMFCKATEYVLDHMDDTALISKFAIPEKLWPKIQQSWQTQRQDTVSGRLDFSLVEDGAKVYEYNADSAATLFECGCIQDRWAHFTGINKVGQNVGDNVQRDLIETWKRLQIDGTLHLLHDVDLEESYHTLYVKAAAELAGISCKVVRGLDSFQWTADGNVADSDGVVIRNVWKTWSWMTVLDQLADATQAGRLTNLDRAEGALDPILRERLLSCPPTLADVLLAPNVRVVEPLWTILPSNKAILPVLWQLYPNHPNLLASSFEPTEEMLQNGYVAKPVRGRCGNNVILFEKGGRMIEEKNGRFGDDIYVYQSLCLLPRYSGGTVQVNCFVSSGQYLGTVLRVDSKGSNIIDVGSECMCLRVVD